jgi:hypothetical protein
MGGPTLGNAVETAGGPGDSGAAWFIWDGDSWAVAGINTYSWKLSLIQPWGTFGTGGGGILISPYIEWIGTQAPIGGKQYVVPEPATCLLVLVGVLGAGVVRRARRRAA